MLLNNKIYHRDILFYSEKQQWRVLLILKYFFSILCTFIVEGKVSAQYSVQSFHSVLCNYDVLLKYGHEPVICLSVNVGSHALKMHGLAGDASQLTPHAAVMFNSCLCVFDWFLSRWVCDNRSHYNGVGGGSVAIKMIIKWQTEATFSK